MAKRLVYVAGPYTAPSADGVLVNVNAAIDAGTALIELGCAPVVPHLFHFVEQRQAQPYETWMALDLALLGRCDALLRLPGASSGADREVAFANEWGIPVFASVEEAARG